MLVRHPFSGKRELHTRTVRERNAWIAEASRLSQGESFWRNRCRERCGRDGHVWVRCTDDTADYCTCCGAMQ